VIPDRLSRTPISVIAGPVASGCAKEVLQDYANTTCDIATGWRLAGDPRDLERLVELQQGELVIDLLTGDSSIEGTKVEPFWIAGELTAWFRERCAVDQVPIDQVEEARVVLGFNAKQSKASRPFAVSLRCQSTIRTDEATYVGSAG
jgi:hypothetical protein